MSKNGVAKKCLEFISELEGVKQKAYMDVAGIPTIGIGHVITEDERRPPWFFKKQIKQKKAKKLIK